MDWQKKYITERYNILLQIPKFYSIFTINDPISDNLIQNSLKFTFTVYEYNISYECILLSYYPIMYLSNFLYFVTLPAGFT